MLKGKTIFEDADWLRLYRCCRQHWGYPVYGFHQNDGIDGGLMYTYMYYAVIKWFEDNKVPCVNATLLQDIDGTLVKSNITGLAGMEKDAKICNIYDLVKKEHDETHHTLNLNKNSTNYILDGFGSMVGVSVLAEENWNLTPQAHGSKVNQNKKTCRPYIIVSDADRTPGVSYWPV